MKVLEKETKFAHLGKPGTAFSNGFRRRLGKVVEVVDLKNKKILDMGCGEGVWLNKFIEFTKPENIYGFDVDSESLEKFRESESAIPAENVLKAYSEKLPYQDNFFDIVFSNEVFEHVEDDKKSAEEIHRILKPGGKLVVFTPNRGWPFETHGMFLNGKYLWGNIFLLPWMPKSIYKKFAPHVKNYWNSDIRELFSIEGFTIVHHKHVFSGFDGLSRKVPIVGKTLQKIFFAIEKTPLHWFGISHFVVVQKDLE